MNTPQERIRRYARTTSPIRRIAATLIVGAILFVVLVALIFNGGFWFWSFVIATIAVTVWLYQPEKGEAQTAADPFKRDWPRISGALGEAGYAYLDELNAHISIDSSAWRALWTRRNLTHQAACRAACS